MGRIGCAWLLIAGLRASARADPPPDPEITHDQGVTVRASGSGSPWIDLAPPSSAVNVLEHRVSEPEQAAHPVAAAATLAGMYALFAGWMYVAWYEHHHPLAQFKWGGDGWVGDQTYAGGADKLGHAWSTMSLARLGTEMLDQWGGYDRTKANVVSTIASELLFTGVEVKDGFYYEFSFSDLTGDTLGALAAFALSQWPRLDELFDYRVEYWPSTMYLRKLDGASPCPTGGCSKWNVAEDYSGQTYQLALHLGAIGPIRGLPGGAIARFVDVAAGFGSRNYKPDAVTPADMAAAPGRPTQELFLGVTLNAQGLLDDLLESRTPKLRKVTHGLFEVFSVPFTYPAVQYDHSPCPTCKVNVDGA